MRGVDERKGELFSYVDLEARVRRDHPLRVIRKIANAALASLEREFAALYSPLGRPPIPPEKLLRAMLLQAFYSIRSERQLMERIEYDLLFRWFVGFGVEDPVWHHSSFSTNRDRLLGGDIATKFLATVLAQPRVKRFLSTDHFSVDGTLIEAWASMKSFRRKGGNDDAGPSRNANANFRGEKRFDDTHESTSDRQARLYRKADGQPAILGYMGHALMEKRTGLVVGSVLTQATGTAEREAALALLAGYRGGSRRRITLGADCPKGALSAKAYNVTEFVGDLRSRSVTPHIAKNDHLTKTGKRRRSAIEGRTTRHVGYALSQGTRKHIEEAIGWIKTVAGHQKTRFQGVGFAFTFAAAVYNLARLPKLLAGAAP